MAAERKARGGRLAAVFAVVGARLRSLKRGATPSAEGAEEPFASIEDTTPGADFALERNAALGAATGTGMHRAPRGLRGFLELVVHNRVVLVGVAGVLVLVLIVSIVALVASAPPEPLADVPRPTAAGEAYAARLLVPPDPALEPKIALERDPKPVYTAEEVRKVADALGLGADLASIDIAPIAAKNDAAIAALWGTVP